MCGVLPPYLTAAPQSVEVSIGMNAYQHAKVNQWSSNIVEQCLKKLTGLGKPFKYIGTCAGVFGRAVLVIGMFGVFVGFF